MFRKKSEIKDIQQILSRYFILLSAILLFLTSLVFSVIQYRTLRRNTIENLSHTCMAIADSVDQQINQMNIISLNTISSSAAREAFLSYEEEGISAYQKNLMRRELGNTLTTAKGLDFSIRQLNIYNMEEGGYGVGEYNGDLPGSVMSQPWHEEVISASGHLILTAPHPDLLLKEAPDSGKEAGAQAQSTAPDKGASETAASSPDYFSLCRVFYDSIHQPIGIVEVVKYYRDVFNLALQPESTYHPTVVIYDNNGRQLFPLQTEGQGSFSYYDAVDSGETEIRNTITGNKEHIRISKSNDNRFIVVMAVAYGEFLAPVYRSLIWILGIFLVLFFLCLLLSGFLSRKLGTPIKTIYHFLSDDTKDKFQTIDMADTGIREIDKLKASLNENIRSRKAATDTLMILKEQEVQAQMLALQSQMNPHFLYNSLSTIAEMAEEGLTEPVAKMCQDITDIIRYISSNKEMRISLEEELEISSQYLECMKMRFGENLQYSFEVDDAMLDCLIPKLCIQLLVENAVKAVHTLAPPWKITISGHLEEYRWYIEVKDNGPGFDREVDRHLRQQMDMILQNGILPSLKIQGMGILNIFIRLYLLDGIPFLFDFGNLPEGGAFVTIGGHLYDKTEQSPHSSGG